MAFLPRSTHLSSGDIPPKMNEGGITCGARVLPGKSSDQRMEISINKGVDLYLSNSIGRKRKLLTWKGLGKMSYRRLSSKCNIRYFSWCSSYNVCLCVTRFGAL